MAKEYSLADRARFFYQYLFSVLYKREIDREGGYFHALLVDQLGGRELEEEAKLGVFGECLLYVLWLLPNWLAKTPGCSAYLRDEEDLADFVSGVMKEAWGERWSAMWDHVSAYETLGFEKAQIKLANRIAEVLVGHKIESLIWLYNVMTHVNIFNQNFTPLGLKYTFGEELFDAHGFEEAEAFLEQRDEKDG